MNIFFNCSLGARRIVVTVAFKNVHLYLGRQELVAAVKKDQTITKERE